MENLRVGAARRVSELGDRAAGQFGADLQPDGLIHLTREHQGAVDIP
jgi:hypothetical protein